MILARLKHAGVEDKLWSTQFGFRSNHGTKDAIFIARRMMEQCYNSKNKAVVFLALDWAKAFDSIDPKCLVQALRRFGLPQEYLNVIANIYTDREFVVSDHGHKSEQHSQRFGISQGCPLSPFLFVMVMTVLLHDATSMLHTEHGMQLDSTCCNELVYADDTLLIGVSTQYLQKYMECIAKVGGEYGLALNWKKVEQLNVNCDIAPVCNPEGGAIQVKQSMKYLGAQLDADGRMESEIAQKLGAATQAFKNLKRIWNHCNISVRFKYIVFTACVVQKLLYSLECVWLNRTTQKKIDGFYAKCLRSILKISPSFISRVSNQFILQQFHTPPLSRILLQRQLLLFGRVTRLPNDSAMRQCVFENDSIALQEDKNRRQGRPRSTWGKELSRIVADIVPHSVDKLALLRNKDRWQAHVKQYIATQQAQ